MTENPFGLIAVTAPCGKEFDIVPPFGANLEYKAVSVLCTCGVIHLIGLDPDEDLDG